MKAKKLFSGALAVAMVGTMVATPVFAKEKSDTTPVSYNNVKQIPDPENPDNPDWAVTIPSSITFTDDIKEVDASVELVSVNNASITGVSDVKVSVRSQNGYKLELAGKADPVAYTLQYDSVLSGSSDTEIASLSGTPGSTKKEGTAKLVGTATQSGDHTDVLTYTVSHGN